MMPVEASRTGKSSRWIEEEETVGRKTSPPGRPCFPRTMCFVLKAWRWNVDHNGPQPPSLFRQEEFQLKFALVIRVVLAQTECSLRGVGLRPCWDSSRHVALTVRRALLEHHLPHYHQLSWTALFRTAKCRISSVSAHLARHRALRWQAAGQPARTTQHERLPVQVQTSRLYSPHIARCSFWQVPQGPGHPRVPRSALGWAVGPGEVAASESAEARLHRAAPCDRRRIRIPRRPRSALSFTWTGEARMPLSAWKPCRQVRERLYLCIEAFSLNPFRTMLIDSAFLSRWPTQWSDLSGTFSSLLRNLTIPFFRVTRKCSATRIF